MANWWDTAPLVEQQTDKKWWETAPLVDNAGKTDRLPASQGTGTPADAIACASIRLSALRNRQEER